jgi:predicted methyltransferase
VPDDAPTYVVTCLYGLEPVLAAEVEQKLGVEPERHWCELLFPFPGPAARLMDLRVAGNVFVQFDSFPIGHTVPDLDELAARLRRVPVGRWEELRGPVEPDISITVQRRGEHNFTYADVEELALDAVAEATGRRTTLDPRPLELRIDVDGPSCRLLGRLTPAPLSERDYVRYHSPGETDASLAAAMVRLSEPHPGDSMLEPFCGGGTIAIEAALAGGAGAVVAGEVKAKRLTWARANAELAEAAVSFAQWNARALPFADRSFDRVVTSPPQSDPADGRPWQLDPFAELLADSLRVLRHGGRLVWLVQRRGLLRRALKRLGVAGRPDVLSCSYKGRPWHICTLVKRP